MTSRTVVEIIDDLNGISAAEQTVRFALDGVNYEIDLSRINSQRLRDTFAPWAASARRTGRLTHRSTAVATPERGKTARIRTRAETQEHTVSATGRGPVAVVAAFREAHQQTRS